MSTESSGTCLARARTRGFVAGAGHGAGTWWWRWRLPQRAFDCALVRGRGAGGRAAALHGSASVDYAARALMWWRCGRLGESSSNDDCSFLPNVGCFHLHRLVVHAQKRPHPNPGLALVSLHHHQTQKQPSRCE